MSSSVIEVVNRSEKTQDVLSEETDEYERKYVESGLSPSNADKPVEIENEDEKFQDKLNFGNDDLFYSPQNSGPPLSKRRKRGRGRPNLQRREGIGNYGDVCYSAITVPVACEICGKVLANGKCLDEHLATHQETKVFECSYCDETFNQMALLQSHMAVHGLDKQFECPICRQRFARQDCLKIHMRLHDKTQCFFCKVCHKAFATVGSLNIHLRIHRGEKPFKCHICGKCFTQKTHVINHIKRHAKLPENKVTKSIGGRIFPCSHCSRSFIRISDYDNHMHWNHSGASASSKPKTLSFVEEKPKKKFVRKVLHSTGTQTESDGGYVIIPRKYKSSAELMNEQVMHSPNAEEEIFEDDMFDEGMDRNLSSDEDELNNEEESVNVSTSAPKLISSGFIPASSSNNEKDNGAFDAMMGNITNEEKVSYLNKENLPDDDCVTEKSSSEQQKDSLEKKGNDEDCKSKFIDDSRVAKPITKVNEISGPSFQKKETIINKNGPNPLLKGSGIVQHFNTKNWKRVGKGRRRRGERPPDVKAMIGLTGPTHLSLLRNSMRNLIYDKPNEEQPVIVPEETPDSPTPEEPEGPISEEVSVSTEVRNKRQAKAKAHGKDFVCNVKTCETCNPNKVIQQVSAGNQISSHESESKTPITPSVEKDGSSIENKSATTKSSEPVSNTGTSLVKEQTQKLLHFLLSGDESTLKGTDFKLLVDVEGARQGISSVEDEYESGNEDMIAYSKSLSELSLPTYSCKLCGRVYRFEGKLHRHIEAVHQKKAVFSPDVRPGKGVIVTDENNKHQVDDLIRSLNETQPSYKVVRDVPGTSSTSFTVKKRKSEIDTLRSEWDDEDDNTDGETDKDEEEAPAVIEKRVQKSPTNIPLGTKSLVQLPNYNRHVYSSGIKVNFNKLNIRNPSRPVFRDKIRSGFSYASSHRQETPTATVAEDTLDEKCQKLLQKLFDSGLLMRCGIFHEHVSIVLGKLLQHYGVKMIEDYGQGQYEVLKYNLWRLIEWKVTMEQMEEFYSEGKSVEEMMDDIMIGRVPVISHVEPDAKMKEEKAEPKENDGEGASLKANNDLQAQENQLMLSQVANVIGEQINLGNGVTQVVLAQDVSPEMLKGAHIVTIDPNTGEVISQVTADQVILADSLDGEFTHQTDTSMQNQPATLSTSSVTNSTISLSPGTIINSLGKVEAENISQGGQMQGSSTKDSKEVDESKDS